MIDMHSHILPGVDDGIQTMEDAIQMLKIAESQGVTDQFLTPHVQSRVSKVMPDGFPAIFESLKEEAKKADLKIRLHLGAEVFYRSHLDPEYKTLSLGGSPYVLVEFSFNIDTPIEEIIFDLAHSGIKPIVAHVERYEYLKKTDYQMIKDAGALLQVNTTSLLGLGTKNDKKVAQQLLKSGLIDVIASDCHSLDRRPPNLLEAYHEAKRYADDAYLERIFRTNALKIIESIG